MERHQLTQSALAERVNVGQATVWDWLQGKAPKRRSLHTLASALGVRPEWLLHGTGQREAEAELERDQTAALLDEVAGLAQRIERAGVEIQECAGAMQKALVEAKRRRRKVRPAV